jgi:hypothetical protein
METKQKLNRIKHEVLLMSSLTTLHYIQVCVTSRKADNLWGSNFFGQFMTTSKNDFAFRATASNPFTYMEANILHSSIYVASEE